MKKIIISLMLSTIILPAAATGFDIPNTESVKSFTRPYDSRFQYSLPEGKTMNVFSRKNTSKNEEHFSTSPYEDYEDDDGDEIKLDAKTINTQKKVIKKLGPDYTPKNTDVTPKDMPMNYDAFPKFFDPNDMMNQQFMPMMTY